VQGRKPKPTHLRAVQGNPGKRALNRQEPKPPAGAVERPAWLKTKAAREAWDELAPMLEGMGVLTRADALSLGVLCQVYSDWLTYRTAALAARVQSLLSEFGLTPSSRSRLKVDPAKPADPLARFIKEPTRDGA
jgi:phage terminase small subunit